MHNEIALQATHLTTVQKLVNLRQKINTPLNLESLPASQQYINSGIRYCKITSLFY